MMIDRLSPAGVWTGSCVDGDFKPTLVNLMTYCTVFTCHQCRMSVLINRMLCFDFTSVKKEEVGKQHQGFHINGKYS